MRDGNKRWLTFSGQKGPEDFEEKDFRRLIPRFSKENFPNILKLVDSLKAIGDKHKVTAGQVTLAWLLGQGDDVIPIPGTQRVKVCSALNAQNMLMSYSVLVTVPGREPWSFEG